MQRAFHFCCGFTALWFSVIMWLCVVLFDLTQRAQRKATESTEDAMETQGMDDAKSKIIFTFTALTTVEMVLPAYILVVLRAQ